MRWSLIENLGTTGAICPRQGALAIPGIAIAIARRVAPWAQNDTGPGLTSCQGATTSSVTSLNYSNYRIFGTLESVATSLHPWDLPGIDWWNPQATPFPKPSTELLTGHGSATPSGPLRVASTWQDWSGFVAHWIRGASGNLENVFYHVIYMRFICIS